MSDRKPVASLGPLLLARKGTAKPAMRAQLDEKSRGTLDDLDELAASQEDLGWNDMGETEAEDGLASEAGADQDMASGEPASETEIGEPEVRRQQSRLLHSIADSNLVAFRAADRKGQRLDKATDQSRRAAFTLRLDQDRHLKLKLASTVQGESAQQLVTRALDHFLSEMPAIETLAAQVRRDGKKA